MRIRKNTWDAAIVQNVLIKNEYGLPNDLRGAVVLDIGAHIGAFAVACQKRNAKAVYCYEPDPENVELLSYNTSEDIENRTQIVIVQAAVVGKNTATLGLRRLTEHDFDGGRNTGHVDVFGAADGKTQGIGINDVIRSIGSRIDLLKVDCEGAEWGIFAEADLSNVSAITAELHAISDCSHPELEFIRGKSLQDLAENAVRNLRKQGFETNIVYDSPATAKLQASRVAQIQVTDTKQAARILWVGDAAVYTGFGRVTENVCSILAQKGYDVRVLGVGYNGDPHKFPFKIYPAVDPNTGGSRMGLTRLPDIMKRVKPDIVIVQDDSWNVGIFADQMAMMNLWAPTIGYVAIDSENVRHDVAVQLRNLKHVVCHTQFGADQLAKSGYTGRVSVAGHGVDTGLYTTYLKSEAREGISTGKHGNINDAFIFGVVAANQPRKRLDLSMAYFAKWWNTAGKPDNAYLYIHTNSAGAYDLRQLADYLGIRGRYLATEGGPSLPDGYMPSLYNAFDVLISTSEGESFGLPHLEAMACGVPQIAVDCGGLPSWAHENIMYVVGSVPHFLEGTINAKRYVAAEDDFVAAMHKMYSSADTRNHYREIGLRHAQKFKWADLAAHFDTVIRQVLDVQKQARQAEMDSLTEFA